MLCPTADTIVQINLHIHNFSTIALLGTPPDKYLPSLESLLLGTPPDKYLLSLESLWYVLLLYFQHVQTQANKTRKASHVIYDQGFLKKSRESNAYLGFISKKSLFMIS
jgi:hypothetical protein